jgi:AmmeMemoRadiSam system protein A
MSSTEEFTREEQRLLLDLAAQSIRHGLRHGVPLAIDLADYPERLRALRCAFVTLQRGGSLRGCIGALIAEKPLVEDVAAHAFAAAFEDPRFPPLMERELDDLTIEISVLHPPIPFPVASEAELLRQLRPHRDGLILKEGWRRATFLPSVWESLPEPREFLAHLKMKAGLSPDYWSDTLRFERYATTSFGTEETTPVAQAGGR